MRTKNNILWINNIKAFCIIAVFFVHCESYYDLWLGKVNDFIHPFYVNAFFFVSGYLLFRKQLSESIRNQEIRCQSVVSRGGVNTLLSNILYKLILPTLLFSLIEFIPSHALRGNDFDIGTFLYKTIGGCTYWFTAALVVAESLICLMLFSRKKSIWFYFIGSCILFEFGHYIVVNEYSLFNTYPSFPWQYKHGLYAIVFMAFGGLYWRYENIINKYMNIYTLLGMAAVYIACVILQTSLFHVLISELHLNNPGIALSLLSTIILIELCKKIPASNLLNYIGQNTIGFYFMSGALPIVLSMIVHRFMQESNIFGLTIVFGISLCVGLLTVYLINRYIPWIFDLRKLRKPTIR